VKKFTALCSFSAKEEKACCHEDRVKVLANGSCVWYREFQLSVTHCPMGVRWFPFDDQHCEIKFESKTHESRELNVSVAPQQFISDDTLYETNGEWDLVGERSPVSVPVCSAVFFDFFSGTGHFATAFRSQFFMDWIHPWIALDWTGFETHFQKHVTFLYTFIPLFELYFGSKRKAYCLFSWLSCQTVYDLNQ